MTTDFTEALNRFATALEDSSASSRAIGVAIQETERRRQRGALFAAVCAVLLFLMIGGIFFVLVSINNTQNVIKDCTDRTRATAECARRGEQNTARALQTIIQGQLTVNYVTELCSKREETEAAFTNCVQDELANVKSGRLKTPTLP